MSANPVYAARVSTATQSRDAAQYQLDVATAVQTYHSAVDGKGLDTGPTESNYVTYQATRASLLAAWNSKYPAVNPPAV